MGSLCCIFAIQTTNKSNNKKLSKMKTKKMTAKQLEKLASYLYRLYVMENDVMKQDLFFRVYETATEKLNEIENVERNYPNEKFDRGLTEKQFGVMFDLLAKLYNETDDIYKKHEIFKIQSLYFFV